MATLKERLARLEAKKAPTTPVEIEIHVVSVVALDDVRRGTWDEHPEDTPFPSTTFYAASAAEFAALRKEYRDKKSVLSLSVDPDQFNFED